jgi:hypothetical protein
MASEHYAMRSEEIEDGVDPWLHFRHVPVHPEDAFHGRDGDVRIRAGGKIGEILLPARALVLVDCRGPAEGGDDETDAGVPPDDGGRSGSCGEKSSSEQVMPYRSSDFKPSRQCWSCHRSVGGERRLKVRSEKIGETDDGRWNR